MLTTQKTKTLVCVVIKDKSQIVKKRIYFRDIEDVIRKRKEEEMRGGALPPAKKGKYDISDSESESVSQFFHILGSVDQQRGCCDLGEGKYEITLYTSCCNAQKGIYYYTTYENHQITAVNMHRENLDGTQIARYPLITGEQIHWQNA